MVYYIVDAGTRQEVLHTWETVGAFSLVLLVVLVLAFAWVVHGMNRE